VEPVYTFRGHVGPVLCLAMSATGEQCFSGGLDGSLQCWNIPGSNIDPYDSYGEFLLKNSFCLILLLYLNELLITFCVCYLFRPERIEQLTTGSHGRGVGSEFAQSEATNAFLFSRWHRPPLESPVQITPPLCIYLGKR
jgi:hypothetical protein